MSKKGRIDNKYVAIIMERTYLKEGFFLFRANHVAVGDYDEEEKIFRDINGNKYFNITDDESLTTEIPYSYAMLEKVSNLKDITHLATTTKDMISEYEWACKNFVYFAGYRLDGETFYRAINLNEMRQSVEDSYDMDDEMIIDVSADDEELVTRPLTDHLENLLIDVFDGKYDLNKLKEIKEKLRENKEDYESAEDSIDLQIEEMESKQKEGAKYLEQLKEKAHPENLPMIKKNVPKGPTPIVKEEENPYKEVLDIEDLFNKVTKTLIAQDEAVERVITELARKEIDSRKKREGILLTGPTGVGKTELMRLIAKYCKKPFLRVDTTQLTIPGYVGKDIEEVLYDLYKLSGKDLKKTENAIIYFDEIDKKGSDKKSDVSGQGVLNILLPFIEGSTYDATDDTKHGKEVIKINTANMTVIFGGAFSDVYKNLKVQNEIGFTGEKSSKPVYRKAETKDFVEHGLMTDEFMGRVTVVRLNDLDVESIKRIMLESDQSAIKIQQDIFNKLGVKLTFTDGYINKVAEIAYNKKTGARALNGTIDETTWKPLKQVFNEYNKYSEVILDENTVEDNSQYKLIKKKNKK